MVVLIAIYLIVLLTSRNLATSNNDEKVIGGYIDSIENVPYTVSLNDKHVGHFCSGTLVSNIWIVTAAHCVWGKSPCDVYIRAGSSVKNKGGTIRKLDKIITNPLFKRIKDVPFDYDIALLRMSRPLSDHSDSIGWIPVVSFYETEHIRRNRCLVSGWGTAEKTNQRLKSAMVGILKRSICTDKMAPEYVTQNMVCAGGQEKDACHDDSGGPMVCNGLLVGVVSWGYGCATLHKPGVYAYIPAMWDFIASHVEMNTSYKYNNDRLLDLSKTKGELINL
ncbi:AAEL006421-PA [Aedes aegypti]|uniref:AAEL006421-PA n=1 Tax=Aedes aegypti TaxID=7159 RepID=Q0IF80_AEDAE|nr:AAEL006421-PA [Aedes aegypti]